MSPALWKPSNMSHHLRLATLLEASRVLPLTDIGWGPRVACSRLLTQLKAARLGCDALMNPKPTLFPLKGVNGPDR